MQFVRSSISGKTYEITDGRMVLNEDILNALKWICHHDGELPKLSASQKKQLIIYGMAEAEKYSTTHSMRYTIMRDINKAIFGIKQ